MGSLKSDTARENLSDDGLFSGGGSELSEVPLKPHASAGGTGPGLGLLRDFSHFEDEKDSDESEAGFEEIPSAFIPSPPPNVLSVGIIPLPIAAVTCLAPVPTPTPLSNFHHAYQLHVTTDPNVREGKAMMDLLSQRIQRNRSSDDGIAQVSQFVNDRRGIWRYYDRPYDDAFMRPLSNGRYAIRSQENLLDSITREKINHRIFSGRGHYRYQTLPLVCLAPPPQSRRTGTFRNMVNKFRKNKNSVVITEVTDADTRSTGPEPEAKKRGFFSRLLRKIRKN